MNKSYPQGQNNSECKNTNRSYEQTDGSVRKNSKQLSLFHNFQKHLITTLKSIIRLKAIPYHKKSYLSITHDIWDYFCQEKDSKRFSNYLLGKTNSGRNPSKIKQKTCKDCQKSNEYLSQYSKDQIKVAQDHLCKEIIRKSIRLLQFDQLNIRRIKNYEVFKSYYRSFLIELENGQLSNRLPNNIKLNLIKNEQQTQSMEANTPRTS